MNMDGLVVAIPNNAANLQLPDPMLRDYYRDEEQRIYWVDGVVAIGISIKILFSSSSFAFKMSNLSFV